MSALRISASLERMGDMAEHIAQLARYRFPEKVVPKGLRPTFAEMGRLDVAIAAQARPSCCAPRTSDLAEEIRNDDDEIDELHISVFDKVLGETWKGAGGRHGRRDPRLAATTSASPTTRSRSPRRCSTSPPATGCLPSA